MPVLLDLHKKKMSCIPSVLSIIATKTLKPKLYLRSLIYKCFCTQFEIDINFIHLCNKKIIEINCFYIFGILSTINVDIWNTKSSKIYHEGKNSRWEAKSVLYRVIFISMQSHRLLIYDCCGFGDMETILDINLSFYQYEYIARSILNG